jgi:GntR family transcriptional regulator
LSSKGALQVKIVDLENPIPKYLQISTWLRGQIEDSVYTPGDKIPTELELSKLCGVNRNTLRQAVSELVNQGILRKVKGVGSFVASTKPVALKHKLNKIASFREDLNEVGINETNKVLKKGIEIPTEKVAETLNLKGDSGVVEIRRLRTGNDIPFIYEESYLPADRFEPLLDMDLTSSMYQMISERFDVTLARCDQTIQAVNLKGKIAAYLNLSENSAGIFMKSVTFDDKEIPVEVLYSFYRGDKYVFEVELGRYHITGSHSL